MNARNVRRPGSGFLNGILNDFNAFDFPPGSWTGGTYERCYGQSELVIQRLNRLKLDDSWSFKMAHRPGHYWVEAVPNSPNPSNDPIIKLDPLFNDVNYPKSPTADTVPHHGTGNW